MAIPPTKHAPTTAHTIAGWRNPSRRACRRPSRSRVRARGVGANLSTRIGTSTNVAIQHNGIPAAPMIAKSAKPLKAELASAPYAITAPSDATTVGRTAPATAFAIAGSGARYSRAKL